MNKLKLEDPETKYTIEETDGIYRIKLYANKLAKNVRVQTLECEGRLSDNYFDLYLITKR